VAGPRAQSGSHRSLDALNRPYANADVSGDFLPRSPRERACSIFRSVFPSVRLRPSFLPWAFALPRPAITPSRMTARSNSANIPTIWNTEPFQSASRCLSLVDEDRGQRSTAGDLSGNRSGPFARLRMLHPPTATDRGDQPSVYSEYDGARHSFAKMNTF